MVGTWVDSRTGRYMAGLRDLTRGGLMPLSSHGDREAAEKAADELSARLDRIADGGGLRSRNLMDEVSSRRKH